MPSVERRGRLFFALALIGFGLENIAFGHYVVARAAPWPADPAQQHLIAYVTGALSGVPSPADVDAMLAR